MKTILKKLKLFTNQEIKITLKNIGNKHLININNENILTDPASIIYIKYEKSAIIIYSKTFKNGPKL